MRLTNTNKLILCCAFALTVTAPQVLAATDVSVEELLELDLRQLLEVEVTLASRKKESQFEVASAIYTITNEDIKRSGLTRIPELLRMVPGLHVGKIDNNTWAISSRNDMDRFSGTMLVMMDGRVLYNNLFSGVQWDVQNTYIDDIERIEVIRGPGATLWGANAVDGVINIITKKSIDTQGAEAYAGAGTGEFKYEAGFRVGAQLADKTHARIYAKGFKTGTGEYVDASESTNNGFFPVGDEANDDGDFQQVGFRSDTAIDANSVFTLQGDIYQGDFNADRITFAGTEANMADTSGYNLLTRWNRQFSDDSNLSVQLYVDHTERVDLVFDDDRTIYDLDVQHYFSLSRQQISWGFGVRRVEDETQKTPTGVLALSPASIHDTVYSLFVQDKIALAKSFALILGAKLEHNDITGEEFQPNVRALWTVSPKTTVWGSVARAVKTPSRVERHGQLVFCDPSMPGCVVDIGDIETKSESMIAAEIGYRHRFSKPVSIDISVFNNDYDNSPTNREDTHGLEFVANYLVSQNWSTEMSYAYHHGKDRDPVTGELITNELIPENSLNLRSMYTINEQWQFDSYLYVVEGFDANSTTTSIPTSARLDLRLGWLPSKHIETSLLLTNVAQDAQGEALERNRVNTGMPSSVYFQLKYIH